MQRVDFLEIFVYHTEGGHLCGLIKLHLLGMQIRGEYYLVNKANELEYVTHKLVNEIDLTVKMNNEEIFEKISFYIEACQERLGSVFLDLLVLKEIGSFVNWNELFFNNK